MQPGREFTNCRQVVSQNVGLSPFHTPTQTGTLVLRNVHDTQPASCSKLAARKDVLRAGFSRVQSLDIWLQPFAADVSCQGAAHKSLSSEARG